MTERISKEIDEDREYWLGRVNNHLEKLLHKANRDNKMMRHMAHHYYTINKVCNIKYKEMQNKLKETLIIKKKRGKLYLLVDASLIA